MRTTFPGVDSLEADDDLERGFALRSVPAIVHFILDVLLYSMYAKGVHFVHSVALTHSYRKAERQQGVRQLCHTYLVGY